MKWVQRDAEHKTGSADVRVATVAVCSGLFRDVLVASAEGLDLRLLETTTISMSLRFCVDRCACFFVICFVHPSQYSGLHCR